MRGLAAVVGSSLTVSGAIAIGWALHRTVWLGDLPLGSPAAVAALGGGVALVAVGWHLEGDAADPESRSETDEGETEYDERFSPVDAQQLDDCDRSDGG